MEKREILRFGCIFEAIFSAKPSNLSDFWPKSATVRHFWGSGGGAGGSRAGPVGGDFGESKLSLDVGF